MARTDDGKKQPGPAAHRPPPGRSLTGASPHDPPDADRQRQNRRSRKPDTTPPNPKKREPLFDIPDVAAILKVSDKTVRRYIGERDPRKRLPSVKMGRLRRVEPSDLENFIRDRWRP
jgi:excisionase family DNA binding protein